MATTDPSPPPTSSHEEVENDNQQPPISCSPPQASVTPRSSPIEDVDDHQQFANSNSPYSPPQTSLPQQPENPVDRQQIPPPEDVENQQEPPVPPSPPPQETLLDRQQPLAPPSSSLYSQPPSSLPPPSPPPSPPPTGPKHPLENLSPNHECPLSKQPPPTGPEDPVESPNYHNSPNPIADHESPSPTSPPPQSSFQSPSATTLQVNPSPKDHQSPKDPSPSTPLTAASPSPSPSPQDIIERNTDRTQPPPPPVGVPLLLHTVASSSPSKPQTSPWTHQETANLIQAYQEKWYSLKKGPLKANQWEEVAITVAARCGYDEPTKSAKQCRHKIEKLRKRYRAERGKPRSKATAWNFFKLMDNLEKGPLPISSSQHMTLVEYRKPSNSNGKRRKNDDSDGEFLVNKRSSRSKSSNHHIANGGLTGNLRFSDGGSQRVMRGLRTPVVHKHKGFYQEDDGDEEEEEEEGEEEDSDYAEEEDGVAAQLAAEIKGFAERFVKMENKKIEMIREAERYRMEMENKRMEMILESQQMLVETVNKAFSSSHKTQKLSAN